VTPTFEAPVWLALAFLAPLPAVALAGRSRRRNGRGAVCRTVLLATAIASGALAAAGPLVPTAPRQPPGGSDLVIVLDVSMSMLAADVAPSRLAEARRQLIELVSSDPGLRRIGLVLFAGDARIACPLTADRQAIRQALLGAAENGAAAGGSDIGAAIGRALALLPPGPTGATMAIVSDGEAGPMEDEAGPQTPATELLARGVRVFVAGIGTPQGADVPVRGDVAAAAPPHHSRLDEARLMAIAARTNGLYQRLAAGERLPVHLDPSPPPSVVSDGPFGPVRWYGAPLLLAFILLGLDTAIWWWGRSQRACA
jgi:Ca-activated chloride channel homolog